MPKSIEFQVRKLQWSTVTVAIPDDQFESWNKLSDAEKLDRFEIHGEIVGEVFDNGRDWNNNAGEAVEFKVLD